MEKGGNKLSCLEKKKLGVDMSTTWEINLLSWVLVLDCETYPNQTTSANLNISSRYSGSGTNTQLSQLFPYVGGISTSNQIISQIRKFRRSLKYKYK